MEHQTYSKSIKSLANGVVTQYMQHQLNTMANLAIDSLVRDIVVGGKPDRKSSRRVRLRVWWSDVRYATTILGRALLGRDLGDE